MNLAIFLIIGAVAGWLAGLLTKGKGSGLIWNIIMGCIGSIVGGMMFEVLGIQFTNQLFGEIATATAGAVVLIFIGRFIFGRK
jgi:uncharacterized membrane protein YeaQ/YmgE (transglycosylase-associated protein family)